MLSSLLLVFSFESCFLTYSVDHPASIESRIDYVLDVIKEENAYDFSEKNDIEYLLCDIEVIDC